MRGEHRCGRSRRARVCGPSPRAWGARRGGQHGAGRLRTIPTCVGSTLSHPKSRHGESDHPHVRGEHGCRQSRGHRADGPSPRAWGAQRHRGQRLHERRTIPTCVGSTMLDLSLPTRRADHPHVRGEHVDEQFGGGEPLGPSPRAWGARDCGPWRVIPARTIPTCVGSTGLDPRSGAGGADHPHVRGEHMARIWPTMPSSGPSPRAWGARWAGAVALFQGRTIPTCVGSTTRPGGRQIPGADHPHVRGEHTSSSSKFWASVGPSPRAWGAHLEQLEILGVRRTIPTCVGSTPRAARNSGRPSDHPHVRGEHALTLSGVTEVTGPSPRAWGAHLEQLEILGVRRTIPTCVGSTRAEASGTAAQPDHPHVRGEHDPLVEDILMRDGPSPRAWGARVVRVSTPLVVRTIPTCVGSTT